MACIKNIMQLLASSSFARDKKKGERLISKDELYRYHIAGCCTRDHEVWSTSDERRARKGLKPLRTLSRGTRRAEFGPNEKASERSETFTGCLRGPSVTLTPSKCNNIYIRAQRPDREGRASPRDALEGASVPLALLYRVSPGNDWSAARSADIDRCPVTSTSHR